MPAALQRPRRLPLPGCVARRLAAATAGLLCLHGGDALAQAPPASVVRASPEVLVVTHSHDGGAGSLREAILEANRRPGPQTIVFDHETGPFAEPQVVELVDDLPALTGELVIDGRIDGVLWRATGVTLDGLGRRRVLETAPGATVTLRAFTVRGGAAREGAGILNAGNLVLSGMSVFDNHAFFDGGGVLDRGRLVVVNTTFHGNRADGRGGGLASLGAGATVTHATFAANSAAQGAGLYSEAPLVIRNSIVADSEEGDDCTHLGPADELSAHNLVEANDGCGGVIVTLDPGFGELDYFNGPTKTLPIESGSPAINLADNRAALDEHGEPLVWDQRGNGDPRYVAGYADLGAFEHQAFPELVVDTLEDNGLRACTRAGRADCPLRGAIELAAAARRQDRVVSFDPKIFDRPTVLRLAAPLPAVVEPVTVDASGTGGVLIEVAGSQADGLRLEPGARLGLDPQPLRPEGS